MDTALKKTTAGRVLTSDNACETQPPDEDCCESDDDFDIDYVEIQNSTEPDFRAGRFAFNSDDYPTHDEAMEAMRKMMRKLCEEAMRETASEAALDAPRSE